MIKLASLALFVVLAAAFWRVIRLSMPVQKLIDNMQKLVIQMGDGRSSVLCGIILATRQATSFNHKILQILATPPVAAAWAKIEHFSSNFGLLTRATLAIAYPIQVVYLNFVRAGFLRTVILDTLISRSGVEIYHDRSKCALN